MKTTKSTSQKNQKQDPQIIDCGLLSDMAWPGPVSAKAMIKDRKTSEKLIEEAVLRINEFYDETNPKARTRCIDGRLDPEVDDQHLGPQVPGGAPGAALAYRLGVDKDDLTRGTFLADAEAMIGNYMRLGIAPGGHRDEHSKGQATVGCGAIDGMDKILATMTDPKLVDDHKRVIKLLMGDSFDRDTYLRVMGAAVMVNGRSEDYFKGREEIMDILEKHDKKSVTTLKGGHQECLVVVNMVPDTTISSNRFASNFKGMQVFGYDVWRSRQIAKKILPLPDQEEDRERFVMARIMTTVATFMALTDGTQRLLIRLPS